MSARKKLLLIDGYHNIFRAFYAIRELTNSKGEPINAVLGFVQMLRKLLRDERPDYVGVALDVSDVTFRTEKYADYKANRAPMPEELRPQIPRIRAAIEAFRIPILELDNYEADDVMGTLSRRAAEQGLDVVLVTADKDMFQLVGDGVRLFHSGRGKLYDAALVEQDFGVPPAQVADVLALMGDAVDNVPGVPGIGEKGARQLILEHGSVEKLLDSVEAVTRKSYREGLTAHREQALLSKELVTIHTDLPVELHLERLVAEPADTDALRRLYAELEFRTLLEELGGSAEDRPERACVEAVDADDLAARLAKLEGQVLVAQLPPEAPVAVAFAAGEGEAVLADLRRDALRGAVEGALADWLADPDRELVGHDLKELLRLSPEGPRARCGLFDLMLASYLTRTSSHGHPLDELAVERLGVQPRTAREAGFERGAEPPPGDERLLGWAAERVDLIARLAPAMREALDDGPAGRVYREIEAPLVPVLLAMEESGIRLDVPFLERMSGEMAAEIERLEAEIHELAGEPFNIQSPQQLGHILFEKLELPVLRRTKKTKSWSTDAETLEELASRGHDLPSRILRYREVAKLKSTYVDALPALVAADGRIHTRFQQAVAATGRISSVNPNLQNIPVRTEQGERIRRAFRADEGSLLVVADYNQIELRVLAHVAREPAMIEAFRTGDDIHRSTAAAVFGVDPDLVTSEQRRAAKTINFGLIYGMSAFGLAKRLGIDTREAEAFISAYFARYGGVQEYMRETLERVEREGRVETLWGRARYLPEIHAKNHAVRENARRMAINARIQGSAADLIKRAMIAVAARLEREHAQARLLLTVHDELVLEAPAAEAGAVGELVRAEMCGAAELDVPLVVDVGAGATWSEAK
ncbi:MAG TPA: DNA polymerase I [Thermoanaerobaculia bacterium]|nr:DNA polymerase I [Thermoanaerobaculia bacterium]